jgi:hypothetical protein
MQIKMSGEKIFTTLIIFAGIAGIAYFAITAVSERPPQSQNNPLEYDIEYFKKNDSALNLYEQVGELAVTLEKLHGLAIGPGDDLYVAGDHEYQIFAKNRELRSVVKCDNAVFNLAIDTNKDIYLGMEDHIQVNTAEGKQKIVWKTLGEKALITSIALDQENVYLADAGNQIVWKYDKSGDLQGQIGAENKNKDIPRLIIPSPYFDLAIDAEGFLWVVNPGQHLLENFTKNGDLRSTWGTFSMTIEGFCGCCNPTHIAVLDDGNFVTSEKGLARVKVYNRIGELVAVVAGPAQFAEGTVGLDLAHDSENRIYVLDPAQRAVRIFQKKENISESESL